LSDGINIFVSGQTGSGKSYLVKRLIYHSPRLVVYLTKREDSEYPGVYFDGLAGERETFLRWWRLSNQRTGRFRLVYRPRDPWSFEEFNAIAGLVYQCGNMHFVAEELGMYVPGWVFRKTDLPLHFKTLLTAGRTRGVTCWLVNQRPSGIPVEIKESAREAYIFHSPEPPDVDYIARRFGVECELKMRQLQPHQHVHWIEGQKVEVGKCSATP